MTNNIKTVLIIIIEFLALYTFAQQNQLKEVYIIHNTHCDYGFTDYPEAQFIRTLPEIVGVDDQETHYATIKTITYKTEIAKSIVQEFALIKNTNRLEITTTLWLNEITDPMAMYMAFPFAGVQAAPRYYSNGYATQVGADQLPHSCGEYAVVQDGVWYSGDGYNLVLHTPDNPLMGFEDIYTRRFKEVFTPKVPTAFSMLFNNYWITNFPVIKPVKVVFRHTIEYRDKSQAVDFNNGNELWAYPVK